MTNKRLMKYHAEYATQAELVAELLDLFNSTNCCAAHQIANISMQTFLLANFDENYLAQSFPHIYSLLPLGIGGIDQE